MAEKTKRSFFQKFEKFLVYAFFVIALGGGIFLGYLVTEVEDTSNLEELSSFQPTLPTRLYDINGRLIAELYQHKRVLVKIEEIPRSVVTAFLAIEDTNFYNHFGIDFMGIMRAAWANLKAGRIVQGGSTLTQQLVKGLKTKGEKTFTRKLYEAVLALKVEKEFSKKEILEMYMNQIYLGHGTEGVASASRFYFEKPVQKLNMMEGAILAALPKAPHSYSPFRSPHESYKKNKVVLRRLVELGHLSQTEASQLYNSYWPKYWKKIIITPPTKNVFGSKTNEAPYFTEYIRQELVGIFEDVYNRGYQVYTTLDLDQQHIAEELLQTTLEDQDPVARRSNANYRAGVDYNLLNTYYGLSSILSLPGVVRTYSLRNDFRQKLKKGNSDAWELLSLILPSDEVNRTSEDFLSATREFKSDLHVEGAFLGMEPHTGRITAMIGGREFNASSQFNRATQAKRQPGSAFKPFVYGGAIEDRSVHYAMGFLDSPIMNIQPDGSMWSPSNYGGEYRGYVHLYKALAASLNLVSVQVYDKVGPDKIIDFASRLMKIPESRFQPNPSLALGASEVTPQEILLGFSIIANGGVEIIPHGIVYITDRDGNVIYNAENQIYNNLNYKRKQGELQVIEPSVSYIMRTMMENVVNAGTAGRIRSEGKYFGPAMGKTGTTQAWSDAWFVGSTTDLAAVVWMGMDNASMTLGRHQSGGLKAAPLWGSFMKQVYDKKGKNPEPFSKTPPQGVKQGGVCAYTGKWPNPECDDKFIGTMYAAPVKVGNRIKRVGGETCDCHHVKTENFLELMQKQNKISDDELGKTKKFSQPYN